MALAAVIESLDDLDEALHPLYDQKDGKYVLQVKGIDGHPSVRGLKSAYEKTERQLKDTKEKLDAFGDLTLEDVEELRQQAEEAGKALGDEELQAKLAEIQEGFENKLAKVEAKHTKALQVSEARNATLTGELETRLVDNELDKSIAAQGFKEELRPAVRALMKERGPKLQEEGGRFTGIFPVDLDGIPGDHGINDYVSTWAKTDEAKAFLPASGNSGSGSSPLENTGGGGGGKGKVAVQNGIVTVDPSKVASGEVTVVQGA